MSTAKRVRLLLLAALLSVSSVHALMLTGSFTGAWFNEDAPGQGLLVQVVEVEGTPTVVAYWFTFNAFGEQLWLVGQGDVDGDRVSMTMLKVAGGVLTSAGFDPSDLSLEEWGELTLDFSDCNRGTASYEALDPAVGAGEFEISRLTQSLGDECTGGISDNIPPGTGAINLKVDFANTGEAPQAWGFVKFEQNANHSKLKVQVKKLPAGTYELLVGGEPVGEILVNNGGNGKLFFRSPLACNWELLDFDPRDQTIDVAQGETVFLTTFLDAGTTDDSGGDDEEDGGDDGGEESCD